MGEYEPNDSRDVTHSQGGDTPEPSRTGPREATTRQAEQGGEKEGGAQPGYGNARDEDGKSEKDAGKDGSGASKAPESKGDGFVGETSADPAARARADAGRTL